MNTLKIITDGPAAYSTQVTHEHQQNDSQGLQKSVHERVSRNGVMFHNLHVYKQGYWSIAWVTLLKLILQ